MTDVFDALADPNRRHLLEELARREASVTDLAQTLPVTRQAVAKHMAALASAGLVDSRRLGRERLYRLNRGPLDGAAGWIARVGHEWDERLGRLRDHVVAGTVCAIDVAPIHAEPDPTSEQVTQALRGEPLSVEERRGGWARIETAYGYRGWIAEDALSVGSRSDWLPEPREGDPAAEARAYLGTPYLWGGMSERGIDCSGLVHMAFRRLGRLVPRDAHEQEAAAEQVEEPCQGDLVTYGSGAAASHIAFWLDENRILHAASGRGVVEEPESAELRRIRRRFVRLVPFRQVPRWS